jgi:hypothetical protein
VCVETRPLSVRLLRSKHPPRVQIEREEKPTHCARCVIVESGNWKAPHELLGVVRSATGASFGSVSRPCETLAPRH